MTKLHNIRVSNEPNLMLEVQIKWEIGISKGLISVWGLQLPLDCITYATGSKFEI